MPDLINSNADWSAQCQAKAAGPGQVGLLVLRVLLELVASLQFFKANYYIFCSCIMAESGYLYLQMKINVALKKETLLFDTFFFYFC